MQLQTSFVGSSSFNNVNQTSLAPNVFKSILNLDDHEMPKPDPDRQSISMLARNTWFDIPFDLPFAVLYMLNTTAVVAVEASINTSAKLSVFINETTLTASCEIHAQDTPEKRQTFEFPLLIYQLRCSNLLSIGIQASKKDTNELFHLHKIEIKTVAKK